MDFLPKKPINPWPARLDLLQSLTGLVLVLFMWTHMMLVSSILLGKDAMYWVARLFEGEPLLGKPYPLFVSFVAIVVFILVAVHAILALRKFPSDYQAYRTLHRHMKSLKHEDTWLWYVQVLSGFALFFLASVHLYQMMTHPSQIGPYASADRVWSQTVWPLYLVLLFVVEIHGGIGIYRLAIKWGWLSGKDFKTQRKKLQKAKWGITFFFLLLGLLTLAAYVKIGIEHQDQVGERYIPSYLQPETQSSEAR